MPDDASRGGILFLTRSVGTDASGLRRVLALRDPLRRRDVDAGIAAAEWPWLERARAAADAGDGAAAARLRLLNRFRLLGLARRFHAARTGRLVQRSLGRARLVVVHRAAPPDPWWRAVRSSGLPVALDVDDALWLHDPAGFEALRTAAAVVVTGSEHLRAAMEARGSRAVRIPTCAPRRAPAAGRPPARDGAVRLLWLGSPTTVNYLASVAGALSAVGRTRPLRLLVVGATAAALGPVDGVTVEARPRLPYDPGDHLADGDIGLMPLPDGEWERGKCAAKIVDYMSAGLPTVASPVGANLEVLRGGRAGILADGAAEWTAALDRLARSADLRRTLGEEAQRVHAAEYDLDVAARAWAALAAEAAPGSAAASAARGR